VAPYDSADYLKTEADIKNYKALSPDGNPSFETVTKIVGAFGMRLSAQAA
jgi:DNA-binding phage protein